MAGIPDPTADLDWSGYVGAIHEIFHKNAVEHPDRPCVTETASSTYGNPFVTSARLPREQCAILVP